MEIDEQDHNTAGVLPDTIDKTFIDAVWDEIRFPGIGGKIKDSRFQHLREQSSALYTVLEWTGACDAVMHQFEQVGNSVAQAFIPALSDKRVKDIKPSTELSTGYFLKHYCLIYFHRKDVTSGNVLAGADSQSFVTICVKYNSRFPRPIVRYKAARPLSGSAPEVELKPGEILVYGPKNYVEYPTGYAGSHQSVLGASEGEDGGFAIYLVYEKSPPRKREVSSNILLGFLAKTS